TAATSRYTLSLHDALPIYPPDPGRPGATVDGRIRAFARSCPATVRLKRWNPTAATIRAVDSIRGAAGCRAIAPFPDRLRSPLLRSEEHTSELQSRENLVCR